MTSNLRAHAGLLESLVKTCIFTQYSGQILDHDLAISKIIKQLKRCHDAGGSIYLIGNGGSAAVASHICTDFCNTAGLRAFTLHDTSVLTCMSNDYGYENAFARRLEVVGKTVDMLIAVSSSGESRNMLLAAETMRAKDAMVISLTGFNGNNPLRKLGDWNCWIKSADYGLVEISHLFILHYLAESISTHLSRDISVFEAIN